MVKRYLYSVVKIPLEISPDGSIKTMEEYTNIEITPCYYLPDKSVNNTKTYNSRLREIVSHMNFEDPEEKFIKIKIEKEPEEPEEPEPSILEKEITQLLTILPNEIKKHKPLSKNMTFKSKPHSLLRRTAKSKQSFRLDKGVVPAREQNQVEHIPEDDL